MVGEMVARNDLTVLFKGRIHVQTSSGRVDN